MQVEDPEWAHRHITQLHGVVLFLFSLDLWVCFNEVSWSTNVYYFFSFIRWCELYSVSVWVPVLCVLFLYAFVLQIPETCAACALGMTLGFWVFILSMLQLILKSCGGSNSPHVSDSKKSSAKIPSLRQSPPIPLQPNAREASKTWSLKYESFNTCKSPTHVRIPASLWPSLVSAHA